MSISYTIVNYLKRRDIHNIYSCVGTFYYSDLESILEEKSKGNKVLESLLVTPKIRVEHYQKAGQFNYIFNKIIYTTQKKHDRWFTFYCSFSESLNKVWLTYLKHTVIILNKNKVSLEDKELFMVNSLYYYLERIEPKNFDFDTIIKLFKKCGFDL